MASKLKAVPPKTEPPSKPKILIYGKPGVGKTFTALDFPSCYYIDTEGGALQAHYTDKLEKSGGVYLGPKQGACDFDVVLEQVKALATEKHSYKTLVIDSISKMFNTSIAAEAERILEKGDKDEYGASKKPAVSKMRRLVKWLMDIDMNVILISHETGEWGQDAKGNRVEIGTTFDCWPKLEYELDLCMNIFKSGPGRSARVRKSRLKAFPDALVIPWSYKDFANLYGEEVIQKESTQIVLATETQLKELNNLLNVIKLPEGQVEKWLSAAQVDSWSEMSTERTAKAIDHIKKTFLTTQGE